MRYGDISKSIYGGLMAVFFNYTNVMSFSISSLKFGFAIISFITGFLVTYSALFLYDHLGPIRSRFLERSFDGMVNKIIKTTENKSSKKTINKKTLGVFSSKEGITIEKPKRSVNILGVNK